MRGNFIYFILLSCWQKLFGASKKKHKIEIALNVKWNLKLQQKAAGVYMRMLESMLEHTLYVLCCYVYVL